MAAKGARKWGVCGHTFHNISCTFGHFSCEIGGCFFGINKHDRHPARSQNDRSERGRHHTKGTRYVVNSLAALLGASAAIWSKARDCRGRGSNQAAWPNDKDKERVMALGPQPQAFAHERVDKGLAANIIPVSFLKLHHSRIK